MLGPKVSSKSRIIKGLARVYTKVINHGEELNSEWYQLLEFSPILWPLSIFFLTLASDSLITLEWLT